MATADPNATPEPSTMDALADRAVYVIDGIPYQLLHLSMMTPLARHRLRKLGERADAIESKDELTPEETTELEGIPAALCRLVLRAPDEVQARLTDDQRQEVMNAFFYELPAIPIRREANLAAFRRSLSTGTNGSRDSSGSTAAHP